MADPELLDARDCRPLRCPGQRAWLICTTDHRRHPPDGAAGQRHLGADHATIAGMRSLRLGFLHLAPVVGDLDGNRRLIEAATRTASERGADWVLSGELVVPGYGFDSLIGTDWITEGPSSWLRSYAELCAAMDPAGFVSDPERTEAGLFNTAWAVGRGCPEHRGT